jgi:alkanesulfonate monooxygenase SsuD/methylene tetrahydromethanopterin reductase-like flavin-dependent oxidoreductase (luciferase family)
MENFSMLSMVSKENTISKIGSSIVNIYSRSPSLIAMGAVTVDTISNKRLVLGLGTSSQPLVEDFHGDKFENPLKRMREYVEIIRLILSGKMINYTGEIFSLKNFSLLVKSPRDTIPIYLAAVNQKMVELTWEIADGVIFYLRPKNEIKLTLTKMQNKKKIDSSLQIITCVNEDSEKAMNRAKRTLAFYVSVGKIYREFLESNGFKNETKNIFAEYERNGLKNNYELVPESMVNELCIAGTPNECKVQLKQFRETGIDLPIIQFNPTDNVEESFNLVTSTFSEESY